MPENHVCVDCSTIDFETGEQICIRCGIVVREADFIDTHVAEKTSMMMSASDHYTGNALLNSQTENMDYVSKGNTGLAYRLNNKKEKDFEGKRIKTSLCDPYKSGNIAGGKGIVMKEDPLTGEKYMKFSMYEKPMLTMLREKANQELVRYGIGAVEQAYVNVELQRIVSRLFFSELAQYGWIAAVLNAEVLKPKDVEELERKRVELIDQIRVKLLTDCKTERVPELATAKKEPQLIKA